MTTSGKNSMMRNVGMVVNFDFEKMEEMQPFQMEQNSLLFRICMFHFKYFKGCEEIKSSWSSWSYERNAE